MHTLSGVKPNARSRLNAGTWIVRTSGRKVALGTLALALLALLGVSVDRIFRPGKDIDSLACGNAAARAFFALRRMEAHLSGS